MNQELFHIDAKSKRALLGIAHQTGALFDIIIDRLENEIDLTNDDRIEMFQEIQELRGLLGRVSDELNHEVVF